MSDPAVVMSHQHPATTHEEAGVSETPRKVVVDPEGGVPLHEVVARYGTPDPHKIGKLPRITCAGCREARTKVCDKHSKAKCEDCGNYISTAHMHLDYEGHADITLDLIEIDPRHTYGWATDGAGSPVVVQRNGTLELHGWLELHGVTRAGVGTCEPKADAMKELIGDLLRNCAMRFGVATRLWSKADRLGHAYDAGQTATSPARRAPREPKKSTPSVPTNNAPLVPPAEGVDTSAADEHAKGLGFKNAAQQRAMLNGVHALTKAAGIDQAGDRDAWLAVCADAAGYVVTTSKDLTPEQVDNLKAILRTRAQQRAAANHEGTRA